MKRCKFTKIVAGLSVVDSIMGTTAFAEDTRIALVVKALGIGFFEAAAKGAEEAAAELGGVKIIYTGPTSTTAEGQIEVINSLKTTLMRVYHILKISDYLNLLENFFLLRLLMTYKNLKE